MDLSAFQVGWAFEPIRSKANVILVWVNTIKLMAFKYAIPEDRIAGSITLRVDKRSRLICQAGSKLYSLNFPFVVTPLTSSGGQEGFSVKTRTGIELTGRVASEIASLFTDSPNLNECSPEDYVDQLLAYVGRNPEIIEAVRYMTEEEDGYLRCDCDELNANGHMHPLHHIDIFYSNSSSLKLGRKMESTSATFMDMLDASSDCHYVGPFD
ncbi:MAG TPA: hypothetical protein VIM64_06790 [Puia sp.]